MNKNSSQEHQLADNLNQIISETFSENMRNCVRRGFAGGMEKCAANVKGGILRMREDDGYNLSFSIQWNRFKSEQYDETNGTELTRARFHETGWDENALQGKLTLEAGCGAGRFTRVFAQSGARHVAFDYSSAVDACYESNKHYKNVLFMQCDVFDMPFKNEAFDYVFCHGVLQHTPDPGGAFHALAKLVKPGGCLSIDVYRKDGLVRPWKSKYIWRPITTQLKPETLLSFLEWFIPKWLPIDTFIKSIPKIGNYLGSVIPCWNYMNTSLSPEMKIQWAIMDTFDALAPMYDIPAHIDDVRHWFQDEGYCEIDVRPGGNGIVGNGRKPQQA